MPDVKRIIRATVDLNEPIQKTYIRELFVTESKNAHEFRIRLFRGSEEVALADQQVLAYFMCYKDRSTIMFTGRIENGEVVCTLNAGCYAKQTLFSVTIMLVDGETTIPVYVGEGQMALAVGETLYDPDEILPSVENILQAATAATEASKAAYAAAGEASAAASRAPYVGANNNWFVWSADAKAYVDSGIEAVGPKGDRGDPGPEGPMGGYFMPVMSGSVLEEWRQYYPDDPDEMISINVGVDLRGPAGSSGGYYVPSVNGGLLSWEPSANDMPILPVADIRGEKGERGAGFLTIETEPYSITGVVDGVIYDYRMSLELVLREAKVDEILDGDTLLYAGSKAYPVVAVKGAYVYLGNNISIGGSASGGGEDVLFPATDEPNMHLATNADGTMVWEVKVTKTSQLTNDSGFITKTVADLTNYYAKSETYTRDEINQRISAIPKFTISVVSALPTTGISDTTIYLVSSGSGSDLYTEYIHVNGAWEILGSQRVDLTGYATETWVDNQLAGYQAKGDYALKSELPTKLSQLSGDSSNRVVTDAEKAAWNGKLDASKLQEGVNAALEQAKASGAFDGEDGSDANVTNESVIAALSYTPADVTRVFDYTNRPTFSNVLDSVGLEYGVELNADGTVRNTTNPLATTGYIPLSAGSIIRANEDFALSCVEGQNTPKVVSYDTSFAKLQHVNNTGMLEGGYYFDVLERNAAGHIVAFRVNKPSSVAYIKVCNHTNRIGKNPILTVDEEITYEMGYGEKLNPDVKVDYTQIVNAPKQNGWSILPHEFLAICYSGINRKPANTVEHFTDAAENFGYNVLKCDLQPTSDGELICCHDEGFTFDSSGYITTYDSSNQTLIHNVTAATCMGYSFRTGEHPCLVGEYLDVCRKYGKIAFITIRAAYMDVVIPKLLEELRIHNMTYSSIINSMSYESLVQWRQQDRSVMVNYTLNFGAEVDRAKIDRAVGLGYCSLSGFSLSSASTDPSAACDFEYARANGIRLLEAIAYKEGSPEACYAMGYDGCTIGYPWGTPSGGVSEESVQAMINSAIGAAIGGAY